MAGLAAGVLAAGIFAATAGYNAKRLGYDDKKGFPTFSSLGWQGDWNKQPEAPMINWQREREKAPRYDPPSFTPANRIKKGINNPINHRSPHIASKSNALVPYSPPKTTNGNSYISKRYFTRKYKRYPKKKIIRKRRRNKKKKYVKY